MALETAAKLRGGKISALGARHSALGTSDGSVSVDKQALAMLIPIIALSIPVVAIVMGNLVKMQKFKADAARGSMSNPDTEARMAALEDDVAALRQELGEAQERLDFTERLLSKKSE